MVDDTQAIIGTRAIYISEIFGPTIQGEGAHAGRPTVFVRTGSCDYRCSWCDTMYAVDTAYKDTWTPLSPAAIMDAVRKLSPLPILITLSGGNPAVQNMEPFIHLAHIHGYKVTMETQGSVYRPWFHALDYITVSPKPPSSGMSTNYARLDMVMKTLASTSLKVVVFDEKDYRYAQDIHNRYPAVQMYLQVGTPTENCTTLQLLDRYEELIKMALADKWYDVTILPQIHVLLWGKARGK